MAKTVSDLTHTGQVNSFTGGLNTDLHPLVQPNDTLTDCVNGTLITYNGNENMLQNDMGNYALEGSELPDGFIPLGLKEHNGIVYIVSHNPNTKEVQIGSYPSPEIKVTEDGTTLDSDPILMTTTDSVDYSFDKCYDMRCVESGKESETQYTEFDVELNFGDLYSISPMEGNIDFQYEQFAIKEENGKITNIDPITDGKMHTVNWTSCGNLCKKYKLNKVLDFTQDVTWLVNTDVEKSRIVGALPNTSTSYEFLKEDFQSITIKNTVKFDRIDVTREDNDELLVGVVHKVITGNPQKYILQKLSWAKCTKTHDRIVTVKFDGSLEYDFTYTISKDDPSAAGFMYFLRQWQGTNYVGGQYGGPVKIQSYPILIHRVNGKDKSVLLYDESGKQTSISELDVKGDFVYQYYSDQISDGSTKIYLTLNDLDTSKSFSTFLLTLDDKGNLQNNNSELLTFEYKGNHWEGTTSSTESVLFLQYGYYVLPLFTSVTKDKYDLFLDKYDNFCLIPGDKLLDISTSGENIEIGEAKTTKYVKLTDKLNIHNEPFYTSVYSHDNDNNTYYGDVECGNITINNYSGNRATLELQKQNDDGSWTTISQKTAQVTNGTATFKDCIVSANIQKAIEGDFVDKCLERVYLAEIGHAPFAHSEDANTRNKDDWKKRFCDNIEFSNDKSKKEKLFEKLKVKYEWNKRKSLYVGKHCGKHNNEFVVNTCDIYGNVDVKNSPRTHATTEGWKKEFNSEQLFVPVTFSVNCETSYVKYWTCEKGNNLYHGRTQSLRGSNTTILGKTDNIPFWIPHTGLKPYSWPRYQFDKWLLYLYTHVFYYKEASSAQQFSLIKPHAEALTVRYVINGTFSKSLDIAGIDNFTQQVKNTLLSQLKLKCKNFDFTNSIVEKPVCEISYYDCYKQWNMITSVVNSIKQEMNVSYNTYYCDVFSNDWTICKWGDSSTDKNYMNAYKIIGDIHNGCLITKDDPKLDIQTGGNKAVPVTWSQTYGEYYPNSEFINYTVYSELPSQYDFSPRFKQIINYGTDD